MSVARISRQTEETAGEHRRSETTLATRINPGSAAAWVVGGHEGQNQPAQEQISEACPRRSGALPVIDLATSWLGDQPTQYG